MKQNKLLALAASLTALGAGCGIESRYEFRQHIDRPNIEKKAGETSFTVDNGVLYVAGPLLDSIAATKGIKLPQDYDKLWVNDELEIRYPDGKVRTPRIANDGSIDTPLRGVRMQAAYKTISELDLDLEALMKASVEVDLFNPKERQTTPEQFQGVVSYHELRNGELFSGNSCLPMTLRLLMNEYSLGRDAKYVAVVTPVQSKEGIHTVVALYDAEKTRSNIGGEVILGNGSVIVPLNKNYFEESRRLLKQVAGIIGDVTSIAKGINETIITLDSIGANYDLLMNGVKRDNSRMEKGIEKLGLLDRGMGYINSMKGYFTAKTN